VNSRLAALLLTGGVLLTACTGANAVDQGAGQFHYVGTTPRGTTIAVADRKTAGAVTGKLIGGAPFELGTDKGKVVVLNFWASWCAPCQNEAPGLDDVYRRNKAKGVTIIGLDIKDYNRDSANSFITDRAITYPNVYDPTASTALQLGRLPLSIGLPWTVVIDKQQRVAAVFNGQVLPKDLQPVLDTLTAES
jgi:thiol-disulfide isomerase/thioredoxin